MSTQHLIRQLALLGALSTPLAAWAGPEMSYGLALNGELGDSTFSSNFDFDDDFSLSGMHMNLSGPLLQAQAGDVAANWDQLSLAGRSFQGFSTGFSLGKVDLSLLGGTVILQPDYQERQLGDLLATIPKTTSSPIYGVRAAVPLGDKFDLSVSQLMTPGATDEQGKSISTLALNYQHSPLQHLALEVARSSGGMGWQLSGASVGKRLRVKASYRQADLGFSSAGNPTLVRRRNGGFVNLNYRLAEPLTLTADMQRYNDGREGCINFNSLALRYAKRKKPTLSLFWRSAETQRSAPSGLHTSTATTSTSSSLGFRLSHRMGVNRVSAQFERLQLNSTSTPASNDTTNRFSLGLSRPLGRQTQLSFFQILDLSTTGHTSYTSLEFQHRLGNSGLTADLGLQYVSRNMAGVSGQATSARAGFRYVLASGSSIGVQYQTSLAGSGSLGASSASQLYIGYSHSFGGSGQRQNLSLQERRQLGKVSGRVFEDVNANGKWDSGEPGVPDVTVNMLGGEQQQTDRSGHFDMIDVRPATYQFGLETKTLPIEYTTLTAGEVAILVVASKSVTLDIPVVRTGKAQGIVFQDTNRNGVQDGEELGIANAIVKVAGSDIISFTDGEGRFTLHGLAPTKWRVSVDVSTLGEGMESTGAVFTEVAVPPNGFVTGIKLGVAPVPKVVVDTFSF